MTPIEKLKALAAAKKAAEAKEKQDAGTPVEEKEVAPSVPTESSPPSDAAVPQVGQAVQDSTVAENGADSAPKGEEETAYVQPADVVETSVSSTSAPDHPLLMELAELEEALTKNIPDFRVILRNIHQKLRQDPAVVTVLSEDEIGLIVSGLATHANAEIVAPRKAKATKGALAAVKKAPVSADDL